MRKDKDMTTSTHPVLPLRDIVVFPHMIVPLFVGREKSVHALEEVMADDKQILLSSQVDPAVDEPDLVRSRLLAFLGEALSAGATRATAEEQP